MDTFADATAGELNSFRDEVRGWIQENFPASLREKIEEYYRTLPRYPEGADWKLWKDRVVQKGWGTPGWPVEYGGGGLSTEQARLLEREYLASGAFNPVEGFGTSMLGPTLLEYGNEQQKQMHLTRVSRGEVRWCQGYSEPGSGSDLASLRTKAEDEGDHYLINGQKIWTSGSRYADWCFCLVRTDQSRKQEGISFILIDMKSKGVDVRPIQLISGQWHFSEVFFTDVKVPKENLVGQLNKGWSIAKRLLQFERNTVTDNRFSVAGDVRPLSVVARDYVEIDASGQIANKDLRARIAKHMMDFRSLQLLQRRMLDETRDGRGPNESASVIKNAKARLTQEREELLIEIMGVQGLGWEGDEFSQIEKDTTRVFLFDKAMSIYSGTTEIQNNIIAKRTLGLLDHQ
ncbi:acyl-CoA dehydrogenase family protein [Bradyrhizobium sp. LHD-71]|uniref:acyl-CoA dehydrogenase family protein n=1 Tax=Bradyrhizobium sp. LHD-71 TaxID=3072141 RepID=UPI00280F1A05|nr:acyl-CoA dehydrogenase family protein [Bradyrhizobium sp. LHD-71]MDQ8727889.1 acyl-CoA dehydrogenase family protein [Bradyrhizobium sp. LHD-71]